MISCWVGCLSGYKISCRTNRSEGDMGGLGDGKGKIVQNVTQMAEAGCDDAWKRHCGANHPLELDLCEDRQGFGHVVKKMSFFSATMEPPDHICDFDESALHDFFLHPFSFGIHRLDHLSRLLPATSRKIAPVDPGAYLDSSSSTISLRSFFQLTTNRHTYHPNLPIEIQRTSTFPPAPVVAANLQNHYCHNV